jgi:GT2 family glycosyltransferase
MEATLSAAQPIVTVVFVPRERFGFTRTALTALYENTREPFELIYVDGGSPPHVRDYLAGVARERGFSLLRSERVLAPNEARNLAVREVTTEYVVFLDNDAVVEPGWLGHLIACARETGAWVAGPLCLIGPPGTGHIHIAGGTLRLEEGPHGRVLHEEHRFAFRHAADVRDELRREPCDMIEFHCLLVRTDVFARIGPLDEELLSANEHLDLALLVREAGGEIWFEPASVITYVPPRSFDAGDRSYYVLRWSRAWNRTSVDRFVTKWRLDPNAGSLLRQKSWLDGQRRRAYGWAAGMGRAADVLLEPLLSRAAARTRGPTL